MTFEVDYYPSDYDYYQMESRYKARMNKGKYAGEEMFDDYDDEFAEDCE